MDDWECVDAEGLQLDLAVEPLVEGLDDELSKGRRAGAGASDDGEGDEQPADNGNRPPRETDCHY